MRSLHSDEGDVSRFQELTPTFLHSNVWAEVEGDSVWKRTSTIGTPAFAQAALQAWGGSLPGVCSGCEMWAVMISHIPGPLQCSNQSIPCSHLWNSVSFPARRKDMMPCYHHVSESLKKDWGLECKRVTDWRQRSKCDQGVWEPNVPLLHHNNAQLPGHKMHFCGVNYLDFFIVTLDISGTT